MRRKRKRKRKRKHKEVHTSNANASTVQYASAFEYSKMVDEVDVLVLLFFLFLGLHRIRRRRLIQRNNKSKPKRLWVREIFRKKTTFSFLVAALTVLKTNFWSYVSPSHLFFQFIFENHSHFCRKEQDISECSRMSIFHLAFVLIRFTRKKCKRKREEMKNFPFLASALVFAFAFAS